MGLLIAPRLMSPRTAGALASLAMMTSLPSLGFAAGTDAQREACMPDAFKLCAAAMPDEKNVEACLRAAGPRLSHACHDVFFPQEASTPEQVTRGQTAARMRPSAPDRVQTPSMPQMPPVSRDNDD